MVQIKQIEVEISGGAGLEETTIDMIVLAQKHKADIKGMFNGTPISVTCAEVKSLMSCIIDDWSKIREEIQKGK